jgi:hypothetical protein
LGDHGLWADEGVFTSVGNQATAWISMGKTWLKGKSQLAVII